MLKLTFTNLLLGAGIAYVLFTAWSMMEIFFPNQCSEKKGCLMPLWTVEDKFNLEIFLVGAKTPKSIITASNFAVTDSSESKLNVSVPVHVFNNGTLKADLVFSSATKQKLQKIPVNLVMYREPIRTAFNLLEGAMMDNKSLVDHDQDKNQSSDKKVNFWLSTLRVYIVKTPISFSQRNLPADLVPYMNIRDSQKGGHLWYLPLILADPELQKSADWVPVPRPIVLANGSVEYPPLELSLSVEPLTIGSFRMRCILKMSTKQMLNLGFKQKDMEDVTSMIVDTNFYFLMTTIFVTVFHIVFDFLAFKNDISFWRGMDNTAGLSMLTVIWRFFSSLIILLYLHEERSSFLVVIPMGISTCIEFWKLLRLSKVSFSLRTGFSKGTRSKEERDTDALDSQFMFWLICLMIPLCLAGSVYSLMYLPHRSWYSWILQTTVNGIYAFGFLLMTPQLFLNYRLKSVAHLPWKALTYKAFNTFIDDFFAFIIVMPTSHRIACLRDDFIFVIYIYQRWLYPVDQSRVNEYGQKGKQISSEETDEPLSTELKKTQ